MKNVRFESCDEKRKEERSQNKKQKIKNKKIKNEKIKNKKQNELDSKLIIGPDNKATRGSF